KGNENRAHRGRYHDLTNDRNLCLFRLDGVFGNHSGANTAVPTPRPAAAIKRRREKLDRLTLFMDFLSEVFGATAPIIPRHRTSLRPQIEDINPTAAFDAEASGASPTGFSECVAYSLFHPPSHRFDVNKYVASVGHSFLRPPLCESVRGSSGFCR